MSLRVIGAGVPRTGTSSLRRALERLLDGPCYHMSVIPGHPFDLGPVWSRVLAGERVPWTDVFDGYVAAVDWPTSCFWQQISASNPDALIVLSRRSTPEAWWESMDATVLRVARMSLAEDWDAGHGLTDLLERFTGSSNWDDRALLLRSYDEHLATVRTTAPPGRLLEWQPEDGWQPLCDALDLPVPADPFPWRSRRTEWTFGPAR